MATTLPTLPWLSWYDPYWWRHYEVVEPSLPIPAIAPPPCSHPVPVDETHCCLNPLIGQTVLARRVEDGYYYLGQIKQEISRDRFLVLFDQTSRGRVRSANLQEVWVYDIISFSEAFRHSIVPGDKVLVHVGDSRYAPATVLQGAERRSDACCVKNSDLLISYIDSTTERIQQGVAIWIPPSLFDRLSFELKLPHATRRSFAEERHCPETVVECDPDGRCYTKCAGWPVCGEECPHVLAGNPYQCSSYYRTLYRSWPWWWKYWYQCIPPPWIAAPYPPRSPPVPPKALPQPPPEPIGMLRSRSCSNLRASPVFEYEFEDIPVIEYDPLSRKVANQINEYTRIVLNPRHVSPCCPPPPPSKEKVTQTPLQTLLRKWKPAIRWMPTNKNQYGANKELAATNYVAQDRALTEWEARGRPQVSLIKNNNDCNHCSHHHDYHPPKPMMRPTTAYTKPPRQPCQPCPPCQHHYYLDD